MFDTLVARTTHLAEAGLHGELPAAHRGLQQLTEALAYSWLAPAGALSGRDDVRERAVECVAALQAQQGREGLFLTGDNVESPPDTSFSINGLARLRRVLNQVGPEGLEDLAAGLDAVLQASMPGLVTGGVHTPNHRWELTAALVQLYDLYGQPELLERAQQWLDEGVDVQPDGLYSERSPNYAAHVTNPSLVTISLLLDRRDLLEVVHDNVHAFVLLTDPDGRVETLQSRRQDQAQNFSLAAFAWQLRQCAMFFDCGACAGEADRAEALGGSNPLIAMADMLVAPAMDAPLPPKARPFDVDGWVALETSGVAVWDRGITRVVARSAPDVALLRRVASGAAANPTFAHLRVGDVQVPSLRLSRSFFHLGPFRADSLDTVDGSLVLTEEIEARYYQPRRHATGYEYEGRFAAEMSFSDRPADVVALTTYVRLLPLDDGLEVTIDTIGPVVDLSLEIGLGDGPVQPRGGVEAADDGWFVRGAASFAVDGGIVQVSASGESDAVALTYDPGEAYTFLGGTDSISGHRCWVTAKTPGRLVARIQVELD